MLTDLLYKFVVFSDFVTIIGAIDKVYIVYLSL